MNMCAFENRKRTEKDISQLKSEQRSIESVPRWGCIMDSTNKYRGFEIDKRWTAKFWGPTSHQQHFFQKSALWGLWFTVTNDTNLTGPCDYLSVWSVFQDGGEHHASLFARGLSPFQRCLSSINKAVIVIPSFVHAGIIAKNRGIKCTGLTVVIEITNLKAFSSRSVVRNHLLYSSVTFNGASFPFFWLKSSFLTFFPRMRALSEKFEK